MSTSGHCCLLFPSRSLITAQVLASYLKSGRKRSVSVWPYVFPWCEPSLILNQCLLSNSCRGWRADRSWQSAAPTILCTELLQREQSFTNMLQLTRCLQTASCRSLLLVFIYNLLCSSGFKTHEIKAKYNCGVQLSAAGWAACRWTPKTIYLFIKIAWIIWKLAHQDVQDVH